MEKHVELIQLLTPNEMKKRDAKFEQERRKFMQDYFEKTGRTWLNYYPRDPVSKFMYDITDIGQVFTTETSHSKYRDCPSHFNDNGEYLSILENLAEQEAKFRIEFDEKEKKRLEEEAEALAKQEEVIDEVSGLKRSVGEDRDWFHRIPVYDSFTQNYSDSESGHNYKIIRYNGTVFCHDYDEIQTVELNVLCTAPRLVNILDFLSDEECDHIIQVGSYLGLKRSTVSEAALQVKFLLYIVFCILYFYILYF